MRMMRKMQMLGICFLTVFLLASCASNAVNNPIDFGKKYFNDDTYYEFYLDGTGVCEFYSDFHDEYTLSGKIEFVWREASDGAVYLFEVSKHYNADHTEGEDFNLTKCPIYFSEDFFAYPLTGSSSRWIKEGSELEKLLEK